MRPARPNSRNRLSFAVLIALTGAGVALLTIVVMPFVPGLVWAFTFAVVADPWYRRLRARIGRADLAAGIGVVAVTLILILPTAFVVWRVGEEAQRGIEYIQEQVESGRIEKMMQRDPRLARLYQFVAPQMALDSPQGPTASVPQRAGSWLRTLAWAILQILIALFTLFFFFRDRELILEYLRNLMPLSSAETTYLFERIRTMTHATIYGTVVVALIQGALGTVMLLILKVPGAVLWGAIMAVAATVPNLGSFVVWLPIAALLALQGSWIKALILAGWGLLVVGTIDNVLYPMLVNKEIRLHTLPVFLSIIGGLFVFGAAGLVLGPVILAATVALLEILRRRTDRHHDAAAPA